MISLQAPLPRKPASVIPSQSKSKSALKQSTSGSVLAVDVDLLALSPAQSAPTLGLPGADRSSPPIVPPAPVGEENLLNPVSVKQFNNNLAELARSPSPTISHPLAIFSSTQAASFSPPNSALVPSSPLDALFGISPLPSYTPPIRAINPQTCQLAFYQAQAYSKSSGVPEGAELGLLAISPSPIRPLYYQSSFDPRRSRSNSMG